MGIIWWTASVIILCTTAVSSNSDPLSPFETGSGSGSGQLPITPTEVTTIQESTIATNVVDPTLVLASTQLILGGDELTTSTVSRNDVETSTASISATGTTSNVSSTQFQPPMLSTESVSFQTTTPAVESTLVSQQTPSLSTVTPTLPNTLTTSSTTMQLLSTTVSNRFTQTTPINAPSSLPSTVTPSSSPSQSSPTSLSVLNPNTVSPTASVMPTTPVIIDVSTQEPTEKSISQKISEFFESLTLGGKVGFGVGGVVIAILLVILILICCYCACSKLQKRRRRKYDVHNIGLSISNPSVTNSIFSNGTSPTHYQQHHLDGSYEGIDQYDLYSTEAEPSQSQYSRYQQNMFRETAIDIGTGGPSQVHHSQLHQSQPLHSQMSVSTDVFREGTLPKLSPLSYSSQLMTGVGAGGVHHGISVDNIDTRNYSASLGSPLLRNRFPSSSPSLRVPTRMALSLQNEESKSAHGSKASIQGSRTSFQGSRPSIVGSGSRSQIHGSSLSREFSSSLLSGHREEDDNFSLPLSGQTLSPQNQNSLESMEIPTRDSPLGKFPIATSHSIGHGKQDFASLTCIPNQLAMEDDLNDTHGRQEMNGFESPVDIQGVRRRSLQEKDFGALTSLDITGAEETIEIRPPKATETIPEEGEPTDKPSSKNTSKKSSDVKASSTKKSRSRAMSKLEKLTSLDYIRASLRLKKKRVSFENDKKVESTPPPPPTSSKKEKNLVVSNKGALDNHHDLPSNRESLATPDSTLDGAYGSPHHHSTPSHASDVFSPTDFRDDQFSDAWHPRSYSDHPYGFHQLSQPTFYGSHMMPQPPYQQHGYPQLSQQYYQPQMRQNYSLPPHPHFVPVASPFKRGGSEYSHNDSSGGGGGGGGGGHYRGSGTPDFSDITTPEPEHYMNKERTTPDHFLEGEQHPGGFHYHPPGYPIPVSSPNGYDLPGGRRGGVSPDALTETSTTSARYQAQSPDLFDEHGIVFPVHLHNGGSNNGSKRNSLMSDGYPQSLPQNDHFNGVPTYPVEFLYSPRGAGVAGGHSEMENYGGEYLHERRRHSDQYEQEREQFFNQHRAPGGNEYNRNVTPEQFPTNPKHYAVRSNRYSRERRTSNVSDSSANSYKMDSHPTASATTSKSKVSWSTEVIEYPRTPSDMDESDFDLNQL